jgi:ABC-type nitrate/sulfonate/bicarbonate transport system permease component
VSQLLVEFDGRRSPFAGRVRNSWARLRQTRASGVALVLVLLGLWEGSVRSGLVESANWPAFSAVLASLFRDIVDGELPTVIGSTLWRMARGYAIGCAIAVPLGCAIALFRPARWALQPTLEILRPIPIPAIIPPLIFLLGVDDALKLFGIAFATFFPVALNTIAGVSAVEPVYHQVARTFGVSRWTTLWRVILPAALPFILAGLRTSLGLALVVAVVAEMIVGQQGVGYYLMSMEFAMRATDMYAAVIILACFAYATNRGFIAIESRLIRWSRLREVSGEAA